MDSQIERKNAPSLPNSSHLLTELPPPSLHSSHEPKHSRVFRSNMLKQTVYRSVASSSVHYNSGKVQPPTFSLSKRKSNSSLRQSLVAPQLSSSQLLGLDRSHRLHLKNQADTLSAVETAVGNALEVVDSGNSRNCCWKGHAYVGCHALMVSVSIFLSKQLDCLILESRKLQGDGYLHGQWFQSLQESLKSCLYCQERQSKAFSFPTYDIKLSESMLKRNARMLKSGFAEAQEDSLVTLAEATKNCAESSIQLVDDSEILSILIDLLESDDLDIIRLTVTIFSNVTAFKDSAQKLRSCDIAVERLLRILNCRTQIRETRRQSATALVNLQTFLEKSDFAVLVGSHLNDTIQISKDCSDDVLLKVVSRLVKIS